MFGTRNKRMHASQGMAPADTQTLSEAALLSQDSFEFKP